MKTRLGFVSNSSSSSFIVGIPVADELNVDTLMERFEIPTTSPLYEMNKSIAEVIVKRGDPLSLDSFLSNYGYDSIEELENAGYHSNPTKIAKLMAEGKLKFYQLWASDDSGDGAETMMCNTSLEIVAPNLAIFSDGGY